jgi:hypothetical protein
LNYIEAICSILYWTAFDEGVAVVVPETRKWVPMKAESMASLGVQLFSEETEQFSLLIMSTLD